MIAHSSRMEKATWPLRLYEKLGIRRLVYMLGLNRLLPKKIRDLEAMLPRLPQRPLRRILPEITEAYGEERHRIGFFLGCAQSLLFAEESASASEQMSAQAEMMRDIAFLAISLSLRTFFASP